jgi:uncharacterized membrane protein
MLERGQQGKFKTILRAYGLAVGFIVLFLWVSRRKGGKHCRLLTILELIIGAVSIITGVYNIILANLSVFTCLCLLIGTALILINAQKLVYS